MLRAPSKHSAGAGGAGAQKGPCRQGLSCRDTQVCWGSEGPVQAMPSPRSAAAQRLVARSAGRGPYPCPAVTPGPHLQVLGFQGAVVLGDEACGEHQVSPVPGLGLGGPAGPAERALTVLRDGQEAHEAQALDGGHLWGVGVSGAGRGG